MKFTFKSVRKLTQYFYLHHILARIINKKCFFPGIMLISYYKLNLIPNKLYFIFLSLYLILMIFTKLTKQYTLVCFLFIKNHDIKE